MQKESLVSIRVRTAALPWLYIFHYVKLRVYKHLLQTKLWGFCTSLASKVSILSLSFSLFLPLFSRLIPWNTEARCVYLFAQASKTHARGSPRWGKLHYSSGHTCGLREQSKSLVLRLLLAFCANQGISSLFLSSIFLTVFLLLYISLSL